MEFSCYFMEPKYLSANYNNLPMEVLFEYIGTYIFINKNQDTLLQIQNQRPIFKTHFSGDSRIYQINN
ncbi:Uncharacterised protein [Chlamydia trachomatis]|nr:Uncharacterised protein [Chlamydia trachomatis]